MFYRWGVDLCGKLPESSRGNIYCLIAIEYYSKHLEVVPLPDKTADNTASAFLANVLARYGACAEVLTDNGSEFKSSFHDLLQQAFIDHRVTSPNHPQADGLAERAVQTVKRALQKHCASTANTADWDRQIHWIALGYRCSKQASTGLAPYEIMFGQAPIIPPAIKPRMDQPINFDDGDAASQHVLARAELLKRHCAIVMANQQVAQHRDEERYRYVRSGSYVPRLRKFHEGDFVYAKRSNLKNTLETDTRPGIYRVSVVKDTGVLVLQGGMLAGGMRELLGHPSPFQTAASAGEWSPRIMVPLLDGYRPSFNTNDSLLTSLCTQPPSPAAFAEPQSAPDSPYQEGGQPQDLGHPLPWPRP
jgi:hypothetical protein